MNALMYCLKQRERNRKKLNGGAAIAAPAKPEFTV